MTDSIQKQELVERLKRERCFWSYKEDSIRDIPDDFLIEKTLNRFLAWYYFRCKRPDTYLKSMATRRLNRLASSVSCYSPVNRTE